MVLMQMSLSKNGRAATTRVITYRFAKFYPYYPSFNCLGMTAAKPGYVTIRDVILIKASNFHPLQNSLAPTGIYCRVLDIVTSGKSSGNLLAKQLNKRCKLTLSERSIRYHIEKLGLSKVKKSLPQLISGLKKK